MTRKARKQDQAVHIEINSFGILIKSKEIAEAQRKHFNLLWNIGKDI
jgi:hypothetical protein